MSNISAHASVAGQSVDNFPTENVTVALGGTAQFSCTPTVNGARVTVSWFASPPNGEQDVDIRTNKTVLGTQVILLGENRSPLVLSGISMELDGATFACVYDNGINAIVQSPESRPKITVLRELSDFNC